MGDDDDHAVNMDDITPDKLALMSESELNSLLSLAEMMQSTASSVVASRFRQAAVNIRKELLQRRGSVDNRTGAGLTLNLNRLPNWVQQAVVNTPDALVGRFFSEIGAFISSVNVDPVIVGFTVENTMAPPGRTVTLMGDNQPGDSTQYILRVHVSLNDIDRYSQNDPISFPNQWSAPSADPLASAYPGASVTSFHADPASGGGIVTAKSSAAQKDCSICPAFLVKVEHQEQQRRLGIATGLNWCSRHDIPLENKFSDPRVTRHIAESCKDYGRPWTGDTPVVNTAHKQRLGQPRPVQFAHENIFLDKKADEYTNAPGHARAAFACSGCYFYSDPRVMHAKLGIPVGGCARQGAIIRPGTEEKMADGCATSIRLSNMSDRRGGNFFFAAPFNSFSGIVVAQDPEPEAPVNISANALHPDPMNYPTDVEVTPEQEKQGIRAWRKVYREEPQNSTHKPPYILMPIFDRYWFEPELRELIPETADEAHPELYADHSNLLYTALVVWMELGETLAINGQAGTGKTEFYRYVAWSMGLPFHRIQITADTELDEIIGRMELRNGSTEFHYGRLAQAWQQPGVIVIDEPNAGSYAVWQALRPALDGDRELRIDMNHGERIAKHPFVMLGMASNPPWDGRNLGTREISDADGSRLMHVYMPMPNEAEEREIIRRRCAVDGYDISSDTLDVMAKIAREIRKSVKSGAFPVTWGLRYQLKVARLTRRFHLTKAYMLAAGDLMEPQFRDQLRKTVQGFDGRSGF